MEDEEESGWTRFLQPPHLTPGEACVADPDHRAAKVMFIGTLPPPMAGGYWVGLMYKDKVGKNDGSLNGKIYFHCPPGHGGFLRPNRVHEVNELQRKQQQLDAEAEEQRLKRVTRASKAAGKKGKPGEEGAGEVMAACEDVPSSSDAPSSALDAPPSGLLPSGLLPSSGPWRVGPPLLAADGHEVANAEAAPAFQGGQSAHAKASRCVASGAGLRVSMHAYAAYTYIHAQVCGLRCWPQCRAKGSAHAVHCHLIRR